MAVEADLGNKNSYWSFFFHYYKRSSVNEILFKVSSLPIISAISNTPGPDFLPTSIMRKGSNTSPALIFFEPDSSLNEFSSSFAFQELIVVNSSVNSLKKFSFSLFHLGRMLSTSISAGVSKKKSALGHRSVKKVH